MRLRFGHNERHTEIVSTAVVGPRLRAGLLRANGTPTGDIRVKSLRAARSLCEPLPGRCKPLNWRRFTR